MAEKSSDDHLITNRKPELVGVSDLNHGVQEEATDDHARPSLKESEVVASTTTSWSIFKNAKWSADGTTILTSNADNSLNTFILPPDLLDASGPVSLRQYVSHKLPSPVYATAISPAYSLSMPQTTLFLASVASLPIRLYSPFALDMVASYPLVNHTTEAYIAPHSLLYDTYSSNGNCFFAGSESLISVFDISRSGEGPIQEMKTIPSRRKKIVGGGVGMKGIVSTLAMSSEGTLAAGTFTRWIGLYDRGGRGGTVGVFELGRNEGDEEGVLQGAGITELAWSSCGRYLCVAERASNGVGVWDIRGTGQRLCWLQGRNAETMQRLAIELVGQDLWAGGKDGAVRVWPNVGSKEGLVKPDWGFSAHEDAVSSATMHPCGSILATCSGNRHYSRSSHSHSKASSKGSSDDDDGDGETEVDSSDSEDSSSSEGEASEGENSLKVWTL